MPPSLFILGWLGRCDVEKENAIEVDVHTYSDWVQIIGEYEGDLKAKGLSQKTIEWYRYVLKRFSDFLEEKTLLKPFSQIGASELKAYIVYLQEEAERWPKNQYIKKPHGKLSPHSIRGHVVAIKVFFGWLKQEGYIEYNPVSKLAVPKVPVYVVKTLKKEHIVKLLSTIDRATALGTKYFCILVLLLDTGMRISELVHIKICDLDLIHGFVTIFGKGQKQRVVPFSKWSRKELLRYINHFRQSLCSEDSVYLFPGVDADHISINSVQQFIRRLTQKVGLDGVKCSPHIFRHTFATQAIANEANVFAVMSIMGHASLQTTLKYTHLQVDDLKNQHNKFSPLVSLMKDKS